MKKIISLVLYNIIAVIIILFILEFFVRLLHPEIKSQGTDKQLILDNAYNDSPGFKPGSKGTSNGVDLTVDNYGLRQMSIPVDTNKVSWLLIGDSVTMGLGVESDSTFAFQLQTQNRNVNILNSGYFGYSIKDYKNVFDHFLAKKKELHIQKILLCWCLNDIYFGEIKEYETPGGGIRYFFNDVLTWLRWNSRLYTFVKTYVSDRPKEYYEFDKHYYKTETPLFSKTVKTLTEFNEECKKRNIEFRVVLLPYEYQLREKDNYQPQALLKNQLETNGVKVTDIYFYKTKEMTNSKLYYLFGDGIHFSPAGHKWIADVITTELTF